MRFEFVADPGHAWLIVTVGQLASVGLSERDITPYSYRRGDLIGLEEDCDAGTFIEAFRAKHGESPELAEKQGTCRGWQRFGSKPSQW